MPTVRVNDLTMYYERHGAGRPLVLVMGLAGDISEYGWLVDGLAGAREVVAFDNRGAGRTDRPDAPYSIELMADDTAGLLRELGLARADFLAISMGGRIALDLALRRPEMVDRLVLVSSAPRVLRSWRRALLLSLVPRLPILKGRYPQSHRAFVRQRGASAAYDCTGRLPELRVPTLILNGRRDAVVPFRQAEAMHAAIPGSRLVAFDGGHVFFRFRERPQFLEAVGRFLSAGGERGEDRESVTGDRDRNAGSAVDG